MKRLMYKVPQSLSEKQVLDMKEALESIRGKSGDVILPAGVDVVEVDDSGDSVMKESRESDVFDRIALGVEFAGAGVLLFALLVGLRVLLSGFK